ncbi:hypothetical protein V493_08161 [Pseudogymnoascus sp. VKM F-4281 (FW-2241)]|nr:hypothetical protein V493_08161 [Pseudogymnoascus sp. VKM F-4281 (FW-2241)]
MPLLQGWLPPSPENWALILTTFTCFPVITAVQWLTAYYPMGKTSTTSCLNIPGKLAWVLMELPAPLLLVYTMTGLRATLPPPPGENLILAGIYVTHYIYRALLAPLLNPSMSPIHPIILLSAWVFNAFNAVSLGGHLAGLGPSPTTRLALGLPIWALGFAGTITHDEILRRGRRAASKPGATPKAADTHTVPYGHGGEKTYILPSEGLFRRGAAGEKLCGCGGGDDVAEGDSDEELVCGEVFGGGGEMGRATWADNQKRIRAPNLIISPSISLLCTHYNSFNPPVTLSTKLLFPGPTPNTVMLPAAICVRPASHTTSATNPAALAFAASSSIPASLLICTAILAWPPRSQARR